MESANEAIAQADHDHAVNAARAALGKDALAAAWAFPDALQKHLP